MLALLLALDCVSALTITTALESASFAFNRTIVMTGELESGNGDAITLEITDPSVRQLSFQLIQTNRFGSISLAVKTDSAGRELKWNSTVPGHDLIIIKDNDPIIAAAGDRKGLLRVFIATVQSDAKFMATYELTVTAESNHTNVSSNQPITADEIAKVERGLGLVLITSTAFNPTMLSEGSHFWQWIALAAAGVWLSAAAWILAISASKSAKPRKNVYL